jgi:hypothetical protein
MKTKRKLLYRIAPHNGGLVFAPPSRARFVARIHEAIASAENWEQFPHLMPRKAYSEVLEIAFDDNGEPRTRGRDPFSGEMVPGWSDGDYPPWLQREMDHVVPEEVLVPRCRCSKTVSGRYRYRCRCRCHNRLSRMLDNDYDYDNDNDNEPPRDFCTAPLAISVTTRTYTRPQRCEYEYGQAPCLRQSKSEISSL